MKKQVLDTFTPTKAFSMTPSGQCRLSAVIPWTYDSSRMMEILGKLLRLLHRSLPWDTLEGHRQRFVGLYNELRIVYEKLSNIQYLRGILQVIKKLMVMLERSKGGAALEAKLFNNDLKCKITVLST